MKVHHFVLLLSLLLTLTASAAAQSDSPGLEVFAGFSHVSSDVPLNGWNLTGAFRPEMVPVFSLVGDLSGTYGSDVVAGTEVKSSLYSAMAGPRLHFNIQRDDIAPFAEVLLGIGRVSTDFGGGSASDTAWAFALGGGIDYALSDSWTARAKAGVLRTHFFDDADTRTRFSLGIVYRFGETY